MRNLCLLLILVLPVACEADDGEDELPLLVTPPIYELSSACEDCRDLTLHRDRQDLELRARRSGGGEFVGRSLATLSDDTDAELDDLIAALVSGEQSLGELPTAVPFDSVIATLWLPDLELSYATGYPPSGVVELDALLASLLDDLSECRTSARLEPAPDCEELLGFAPD